MIPKANGKMRPLTVAPPRDKIVQEVLRMILEVIFEPTFSNHSHGFRPTRSCHSALRQIKTQFGSSSFYLEGDISKCFDSFDHHVLMKIIEHKVKDRRFTALLWKALRAGYFEFHEIKTSITGTPQGSIISPLLANIYLNKLDQFMEERMAAYARGKEAKINLEYKRLDYQQRKAFREGNTREALKFMKLKQLIPSRIKPDPDFRRMYYVRYADD
jgi:group II intron reverse transcriptase/maturase